MNQGKPAIISGRVGGTLGAATVDALRVNVATQVPGATIARSITIQNLDLTNDLHLYLPADGEYITLRPAASLSLECMFNSFAVASSAATVEWEAILVVG